MSHYLKYRMAGLALLSCLIMSVGCAEQGPSLGAVSGTVTLDGKPLPNVIVSFVPVTGGRPSVGTTDENGKYQLAFVDRLGALTGKHKVSITTVVQGDDIDFSEISSDDPRYEEMVLARKSDYDNAVVKEPLPAAYNSKSELIREVESGANAIDFALTSDGKQP
ncbi:carboxypeptidase-like regulatory domain-containing protein [Blastopirellula sp. JC732]|uniref:Carboxypeptidase-like regulatory domain-containing protein n=1 Tax=Blastopirellula sediminis TaxID=2894196 RepID=A0A9X1SHP7_9BACT|nr:carboxypeptidase-like regulatory domain-containing protein [Blastopirellula sediminis]MCC9606360.1 carboxypeptidase-like regulatory domain-containing protein [Blastopirellula sediminis]MCC9630342.1 carboxypeptidase-like regulatory domain-containing protein [Blastopirellula sediminis]